MTPLELIEKYQLTMKNRFIPYSQSRNAKTWRSLNYFVTLLRRDYVVIQTDYSMGEAHCPAYKKKVQFSNGKPDKHSKDKLIEYECENGKAAVGRYDFSGYIYIKGGGAKIEPKIEDVLYSLVMDLSILDEGTFTNWADCYGYSSDSIKAKKIYDECLQNSLKIYSGLGHEFITDARLAYEDY